MIPIAGILTLPTTLFLLATQKGSKIPKLAVASLSLCILWACLVLSTLPFRLHKTLEKAQKETNKPISGQAFQEETFQILLSIGNTNSPEQTKQAKATLAAVLRNPENYNPPCLLLASKILDTAGELKKSEKMLQAARFLEEIGWLRGTLDCHLYQNPPANLCETLLPQFKKPKKTYLPLGWGSKNTTTQAAVAWDKIHPKNYPRDWPKTHGIEEFLKYPVHKPPKDWEQSDHTIRTRWENKDFVQC